MNDAAGRPSPIDDELGRGAKERAAQDGVSLSALVARALQEVLAAPDRHEEEPINVLIYGPLQVSPQRSPDGYMLARR